MDSRASSWARRENGSKLWLNGGSCVRGSSNWNHLEVDPVRPVCGPLVKECFVVGLHHLVAAAKVQIDPAGDVAKPFRCQTAFVPKAPIDGCGLARPEVLDHRE